MQSVPASMTEGKVNRKQLGEKKFQHILKKTSISEWTKMLPERRIILNTCLLPGAYFAKAKSGQQKGNKSKERTGPRGEVNYLKMERKNNNPC